MLKWEGLHMTKQNCSWSLISQHTSCVFESQPITGEFLWTVGVQIKRGAWSAIPPSSSPLSSPHQCFMCSCRAAVIPLSLYLHSGIKVKVQQLKLTDNMKMLLPSPSSPSKHHPKKYPYIADVCFVRVCVCVCMFVCLFTGTAVIQCYQEGLPESPADSRCCP